MNTVISFLSIALLFSILINAQESGSLEPTAKTESKMTTRNYLPLLIDPGLTMKTGAENIRTFHAALTSVEDKLIGTQWFKESNSLGKIGGVAGRFVKYAYIDLPLDYFSVVFSHEYLGHGARYRELNMDGIHYGFDWPPPYGPGGGEATNYKSVFISAHEILSIWEGGIEVHSLINKQLGMGWMMTREMNYREASQYFWSFQIVWDYIQGTNEDLADGTKDNDPRAYVRILNANSGYSDLHHLKMSVKDLKSKMMVNAVNPFVLYSLYSLMKTYLWDGSRSNSVPAFNLGDIGYLPSFRAGLTPFGIQYHLENYVRYKSMVSLIDVSYGDQTFFGSWGGIGVNAKNVYQTRNLSFDWNGNIWKQPKLQFGLNPTLSKGGGIGGAFSLRGHYNFCDSKLPLAAVLELGYKSTGFLEGYSLGSSPILILGMAFRN